MWVVRVALQRPYTFVVLAILIAIFGVRAALSTPTEIFPSLNIPVVSGLDRQRSREVFYAGCNNTPQLVLARGMA